MNKNTRFTTTVALIVALGGFLKAANALAARRFDYAGATASSVLNGAFARPEDDDADDDD